MLRPEKGLAYCGLACCVCSENEGCAGCRNEGCRDREWCKSFRCCREKQLRGCWECEQFPCKDNPMLGKLRVRTFAAFIRDHGEDELLACLQRNERRGVVYHQPGALTGDYDLPTEAEILRLLTDGPV